MNTKEYLKQIQKIDKKINFKLEEVYRLRSMACRITNMLKETPNVKTTEKSNLENMVIKIVALEEEIDNLVDSFADIRSDIIKKLEHISNDDFSMLIELRYLCFNSWKQIANKMQFSISYVYKQHHLAIKEFEKYFQENEVNDLCQ